ncbi:MAG: sigma 54-interacting transcriptional regulator, partial [Desulfobacteraceae bacterium]|nr:sigma 54-interacting transcriptional regulator [Desulfobacteraceae bacterium]
GILFGTSKGAFTGSINKAGLFERTSQGTIFLDEINSMPVGLQSKILRIVQEGKVRRVGALKEIKFDLKIISSVNQDPHISITSGSLRADLFYRLGVVFIHIVPLRDRPTDLPLLVAHFIAKHNKALGRQVRAIDNQVMEMFGQYQWPGNVRELEHVIEGAMNIMGQDDMIQTEHLQPHFTNGCGIISSHSLKTPRRQTSQAQVFQTDETKNADLLSNTNEHEKKMVWQALMQYRGNVTKSAEKLGISRQLLYYKMKKYHLTRDRFQ